MSNPSVFISYSRKDREFVDKLVASLRDSGIEVWFDFHLLSGQDWDDSLEKQIKDSDYMIMVLSTSSVVSDNVKNEMRFAMDIKKDIHPIRIEECELPLSMRRMHYIDFKALGFKNGVLQLINDITKKGPRSRQDGNTPTRADLSSLIKRVVLVLAGLILVVFLYMKFGQSESPNHNDDDISADSSEWTRVDSLASLKDNIDYLSRYGDSEGMKKMAITKVSDMLRDEGAVNIDRDKFNDFFDNQFYIRTGDTLYETNATGERYVKPEKGDLMIALKKIVIMDPSTMMERSGFYIMPGDVIRFDEIINEDQGQVFFSYHYTTIDVSQAANSKVKIIGNHPYWNNGRESSYNFNAMTSMAYFNYKIDPTSGSAITNDWETAEIPGIAKRNGKEVLLTVSLIGESDLNIFLNNPMAISASIGHLVQTLGKRESDGIIIDFGDVPAHLKNEMTNYITRLTTAMRKVNSTYKCLVVLPFLDIGGTYDILAITPYVDYFIIGLNDPEDNQFISSPITSFDELERSLHFYLNGRIPGAKLMVTISYFGSKWELKMNGEQDYVFVNQILYSDIKENYPYEKAVLDDQELAMYLDLEEAGKKYRIWFESPQSLARKYDYLLEARIAGISIWALGYDKEDNDLENVLLYKMIDRD